MRPVGVEEEFLIVDGADGQPVALGDVLERLQGDDGLSSEMKQEQIETCTLPRIGLAELARDITTRRASADTVARSVGARSVALATSPLPVTTTTTPGLRYEQMVQRFGLTAAEQLTCGCHVHVEVESDEEGVAVLDRIRVWLPVVAALTANSPFWNGVDTGYASYRAQAWNRWPTAGPCEIFGSAEAYHAQVRGILRSGVPLDEGQIYFDARLSHRHPTVEIRVGDVCLFADDAVLLAAVVRGLVETAARQWRAGVEPVPASATQLRLACWQASRFGLDGQLMDPPTGERRAAFGVVMGLLDHLQPALKDQGELGTVEFLLFQALARGTGAVRQRTVHARAGSLGAVVADAVEASNLPVTSLQDLTHPFLLSSNQDS
ncbi:glutamate--cysteine ligase [Arthrobacter agilis]|jgi:carboxylate-amine ligase|uniref:glutamate--cysteine ligase n=1 Tax=Arthrobacter agilis TaxID=37921 RepID=UPI0027895568|nr:glutamate--cysteine ligase [Arthrobacter agilis]MDQ0734097.1 carboxylate-amine ligase [Arthrobacter agilis]